jgi:hypothetical protein
MPGMGMAMSGPAKVINGIVGTIGAKRGLDAGILARDEKNHQECHCATGDYGQLDANAA